jgi:hypothetical protein
MEPHPLIGRVLARFILFAAAFGCLAIAGGTVLVKALLPSFRAEIHWLDDSLRIDRLALASERGETLIVLEVGLAHPVTLNGHTFQPDPRGKATSSTLAGNLFVPTVVFLSIVFAVASGAGILWAWRMLLSVPALLIMWALGVPFVLWGSLYGLLLQAAAPTHRCALVEWADFVSGGGEISVAILLAFCVLRLSPPRDAGSA